jgi:hypothetical protein
MPRASWRGHLGLSLGSCPIYLPRATARTKPLRLRQVWQATPPGEAGEPPTQHRERDVADLSASRPRSDQIEDRAGPLRATFLGSRSGLTIRPSARKSRKTKSSGDTSMSAANSHVHIGRAEGARLGELQLHRTWRRLFPAAKSTRSISTAPTTFTPDGQMVVDLHSARRSEGHKRL